MTYNPFWIEATSSGLRAYFMPGTEVYLYVYEAEVKWGVACLGIASGAGRPG
jgi:hypothetical protein